MITSLIALVFAIVLVAVPILLALMVIRISHCFELPESSVEHLARLRRENHSYDRYILEQRKEFNDRPHR